MYRESKISPQFRTSWIINGAALLLLSFIMVGGDNLIKISGFFAAIFSPVFSGVVNAALLPIAGYVKVPQTFVGNTLATLLANLLILIFLTALFGASFYIHGFGRWLLAVLLLSAVSLITAYFFKGSKR